MVFGMMMRGSFADADAVLPIVILLVAAGIFAFLYAPTCSAKKIKTKQQAQQAMMIFFSSNSTRAQKLIDRLRHDGLTDEHFEQLRTGCLGCSVFEATNSREDQKQNFEPGSWYALTGIAPSTAKKMVILEIECSEKILLHDMRYGG